MIDMIRCDCHLFVLINFIKELQNTGVSYYLACTFIMQFNISESKNIYAQI